MNNSIRLPNAPIFNREKFDCYYCEPEKFKEDFKSFTYLKDEEDIKKFFSDDQILDEDVFENNVSGTSLNKAASISSPGNLSSVTLVSCKAKTSGLCLATQSNTCGKRTRKELTFHVAILNIAASF